MFGKKISLPMQLIAIIVGVFLFGNYLDARLVSFFYTFSLLFKELLSFLLPVIIFSFVVAGILSFKRNAPIVLAILVGIVCLSNGLVALLSYFLGSAIIPFLAHSMSVDGLLTQESIKPLFALTLPSFISSGYAMLAAVVLGLYLSFNPEPKAEAFLKKCKAYIELFLNRYFIPFLPLYVLGFLLEIQYKGILGHLFVHYGTTCMVIVAIQLVCILCYYLLAAGGSIKQALHYIANAMPSYITAFSTMSSTATVPVSIECAEKNIDNKPLAELSMPIMANIHLLGDSVGTPMLALVTSLLFMGKLPGISAYMVFVLYFCTAMLAVSGIPGGGIIVMEPVLISQFGFDEQMIGIVTALYLLLDPFGTAANVMGDGALVIVLDKILKRLRIK